jgi:hypothetical protein
MASVSVDQFMRFCSDSNIDHKQIGDSLRKYLLSYQRNIERKGAFKVLFADTFINWDYIERNLPKMDCIHWITIFKYFDFSKVSLGRSVLYNIQRHLKTLGLDESTDLVCRVFLLTNMNFIASQYGMERLLCEYEVPDAFNKSLHFFALCADASFDMVDITAVFCQIMKECEVDEAGMEQQIHFVNLREEELSSSFKMKQIRMMGGRPRLRSKLVDIKKEVRSVVDMDEFDSWGRVIKFPNVFSLHMKHRLYFLMSQVHIPSPLEHVSCITNDGYVCKALESATVQKPDVDILYKVITSLKLMDEPFKELHDFRCECTGAFPVTQLGTMRLNDMLHMYVCAYQNPLVWKDVWKLLVPLLSHQVIRDVETFTHKRPFNYRAVLAIMNGV